MYQLQTKDTTRSVDLISKRLLQHLILYSTELNDLRIIICLGKSEVTFERIAVCNVFEIDEASHALSAMLLYK